MRAPTPPDAVRSRHVLPLALCAGVIALAGCPKMPRISPDDPRPTPSASATLKPTPSPSPSPEATPTPNEEPTLRTVALGSQPQAIAFASIGTAYVTLAADIVSLTGELGDKTAPATASLTHESFTVGAPAGILTFGDTTWFADPGRGEIRRIMHGTHSVIDFAFGGSPARLAKDRDNVWFTDSSAPRVGMLPGNAISGIRPVSANLPVTASDILVDRVGLAWALGSDGSLMKLSFQADEITVTPLAMKALKEGKGLAQDDAGNLWITAISTEDHKQLMKLSANGTSTEDLNLDAPGFVPGRFAIRGNFAWIADAAPTGTTIKKVSLTTGEIAASYELGGRAAEVVKDDGGDLWLPIVTHNIVVKLDF